MMRRNGSVPARFVHGPHSTSISAWATASLQLADATHAAWGQVEVLGRLQYSSKGASSLALSRWLREKR